MLTHLTLLLMISFASVNAVLFTPALPDISAFFQVTESVAQQTITGFLIGYALGQLIYGPLSNRFGRKKALYAGISLQIISSFLCVLAGTIHQFSLLILGRLLLAMSSGVGLKMTFTLVNEYYEPKLAVQKISYLMLSFAVAPGLSVTLGGFLNAHFGWQSCFYAGAIYGLILLLLATCLQETKQTLEMDAFKIKNLITAYATQFKNKTLIGGALLMGTGGCFVYLFAAIAPFVAINLLGMTTAGYGTANLVPTLGLVIGSILSAQFSKKYAYRAGLQLGIWITTISAVLMLIAAGMHLSPLAQLFLPMTLSYVGLSFIFANASTFALSATHDKAHGSAVMNFINMGLVTLVVLSLSLLPITTFSLPIAYLFISIGMIALLKCFMKIS